MKRLTEMGTSPRDHTLAATREEVWTAVNWCRFGRDVPAGKKLSDAELAAMEERYRTGLYADLAEAVAITGCGSDDLRRMTCPMLDRVIRTTWEKNGRTFKNVDLGVKTRAWYALVGEIEVRVNVAPTVAGPGQEGHA